MTETDDRLITAAAIIGESRMPKGGKEHACGDGDGGPVVDESEEQVLAHVAHGRPRQPAGADDFPEVALHHRDAGALHRDVGAGTQGDADIGQSQTSGASFTPSPAMATVRPSRRNCSTSRAFLLGRELGVHLGRYPMQSATVSATRGLSPVAMTTRRPMRL